MIGLHPPKDFRMNTRTEEVRVKGNPMRQQSGNQGRASRNDNQ